MGNFPSAFYKNDVDRYFHIHYNTKNASFIKMHIALKRMGIKNNKFMLALYQPELANVDPFDYNSITPDIANKIATECKINPWYFHREIVRIEAGAIAKRYELNRANMAMIWLVFQSINVFETIPRQTGKSICAQGIIGNMIYITVKNYMIAMITQDAKSVQDNVRRLKMIRDNIPKYLVMKSSMDTDNKEGVKYAELNNTYKTYVGAKDKSNAEKVCRGNTTHLQHWDEIAYTVNTNISYPAADAAMSRAKEVVKDSGTPSSKIITTTAAQLDSEEGKYAYNIMSQCARFEEIFYDCANLDELQHLVSTTSLNDMVYVTYSYLQLGFTHQWFQERSRTSNSTQDQIDKDYLNKWKPGTANSVVSTEVMTLLSDNIKRPSLIEKKDGMVFNWYFNKRFTDRSQLSKFPCIMGTDCSAALGNDFTTMVIVDPIDLSVIGTCRCNEANLVVLSSFISKLLLEAQHMVWIPESNSVGMHVVDYVTLEMQRNRINPWTRIFNTAIQKRGTKEYRHFDIYGEEASGKNKKLIGFHTTEQSRVVLYKSVMNKAFQMNPYGVNDEIIVNEVRGLTVRNGRVDHKSGGHDDMLIAYLLCVYFVLYGDNISMYGLDPTGFCVNPDKQSSIDVKAARHQRNVILEKIKRIESNLYNVSSPIVRATLERSVERLKSELPSTDEYQPQTVEEKKLELIETKKNTFDLSRWGIN